MLRICGAYANTPLPTCGMSPDAIAALSERSSAAIRRLSRIPAQEGRIDTAAGCVVGIAVRLAGRRCCGCCIVHLKQSLVQMPVRTMPASALWRISRRSGRVLDNPCSHAGGVKLACAVILSTCLHSTSVIRLRWRILQLTCEQPLPVASCVVK